MSKENPVNFVCKTCGSENISVSAYAFWDKEKQEWYFELADTSDYDFCHDCFGEDIVEKPLTDLKTAARVAIKQNEVA